MNKTILIILFINFAMIMSKPTRINSTDQQFLNKYTKQKILITCDRICYNGGFCNFKFLHDQEKNYILTIIFTCDCEKNFGGPECREDLSFLNNV